MTEQIMYKLKRVGGKPYWFRTIGGVLCVEIGAPTPGGGLLMETYSINRARQLNNLSAHDHEAIKCLCYNEAHNPQVFVGKEGTYHV